MKSLRFSIPAIAGAAVLAVGYTSLAVTANAPAGPTIDQIVSARKAAMTMSVFVLGDLKIKVEKGAPATEQAFMARSLANWANALPGMFPPGTVGTDKPFDDHARPEIWTNWPTFERCAADYIEKTEKLKALTTEGNDPAAVKMQIGLINGSCNGCHEAFRFNPHDKEKKP
jgi:cytochrome c556